MRLANPGRYAGRHITKGAIMEMRTDKLRDAVTDLINALEDWVNLSGDPDMPMAELENRARQAIEKAKAAMY